MKMSTQIWNDAGLLREFVVERYGPFILSGGSLDTYRRYCCLAERMAALTGIAINTIFGELITDAEAADALVPA